ncbi:glycoside hydrolase family 2 protein [Anditalea andensis]|nr:glycoside hydrolase family 2 [Anditalea andensis]
MSPVFQKKFLILLFSLGWFCADAQQTQIKYLSGTGSDDTVDWEFFCTEGNKSGEWTTIPVPSNWELFGFGKYNYGHAKDEERGKEEGLYKYNFDVPNDWKNMQVKIVFEGSMTDTEVKINGKLAGKIHQGAYYRFDYDISRLLNYGKSNLLEVRVAKHSANTSINKAERHADYWIFGGIFRPVYLEAKPTQNIRRVAVDAQANGTLNAEVFLHNIGRADQVTAQVMTLDNKPVGESFSGKVSKGSDKVSLQSVIDDIKTWNPEDPNLYKVKFTLYARGNPVHEMDTRFGFRTVEKRDRDGIYVNEVKIKFKGVNRHTFWPTTGRASNKTRSIEDVKLMQEMNMNAVRMSHYPPDTHFLDVCDSLGMMVLDELAGWHDAYDTEVGSRLVKQMVTRDVNHPSIVLWTNGNESGHNYDLVPLYAEYDIQNREVVHPWQPFNGMATQHYRGYDYGSGTYWHGHKIVFPTEFLHGLYDGGSGAGLHDFWELMWNKPRAAGGFLWVFADEGVVRTDQDGKIDTYGSAAPDGIVGPFHEKEGSFFAIKDIWSPVRFENIDITKWFDGSLNVENRYFFTNLEECSFSWRLAKMPLPNGLQNEEEVSGTAAAPSVEPGHKGKIKLDMPADWFNYDVLYVTATDKFGKDLYEKSWPITLPEDVIAVMMNRKEDGRAVTMTETGNSLIVQAGSIEYTIGKNNGILEKVVNSNGEIPFVGGPSLSAGEVIFESLKTRMEGDTLHITSSFGKESRMKEFTWTFFPSGMAKLNIYYVPKEYDVDFHYMGVDFNYPEELVKGIQWLGRGPYRVWKNRMQGVEMAVHQKDYNNTITGVPPLIYPEFKGYHANLYWAKIESKEQAFTVATSSEDVFLRLFTPAQPEEIFERTAPPFPNGDISFMQAIPAIGTKSNEAENLGPSGRKNIFFDYGPYDDWRLRSKVMDLYFDFSAGQ